MEYKINTLLPIQFEKIENPPYLNDSRFQAVRCYVAHEKENYNGSYFDLSVLEAMGKNMAGIPIVGYISINNVNEADFNGHEQKLIIDNNGISIEYLGRAYGCIISNDDVSIVDRMHEDGSMRKYLCVTGVLWKMFTDAIDIFDRDTTKGHSMELQEDSIVGKFEKDGYYHFSEATVRALCILGEGISPAMSNSVIEKFSQPDIDYSIQELLKEVNESIKQFSQNQSSITPDVDDIKNKQVFEKEDEIVDEKLELLKKYNLTPEKLSFSIEELTLEEIESKINEQFALLASQKQEELSNSLREEKYRDRWGDEYSRYSYVEHNDSEVFAYDKQDNWRLYGFTYTMSGDKVVIDFATKKRKKFEIVDFVEGISIEFELFPKEAVEYEVLSKEKELAEKFTTDNETAVTEFKTQLDTITAEYEKVKPELTRLQEFETKTLKEQRQTDETELFSKFDEELNTDEQYKALKSKASEFSLEELEIKCFAMLGKKKANFSLNKKSDSTIKINIQHKDDIEEEPYGGLVSRHLNKQ